MTKQAVVEELVLDSDLLAIKEGLKQEGLAGLRKQLLNGGDLVLAHLLHASEANLVVKTAALAREELGNGEGAFRECGDHYLCQFKLSLIEMKNQDLTLVPFTFL